MKTLPRAVGLGLLLAFQLRAGSQPANPGFQFGLNAGVFVYQGDLTPSRIGSLKTALPGVEIYAEKPFRDYLSIRANLAVSRLRGDESRYSSPAYRQERNLSFTTPLIEFSLLAVGHLPESDRQIFPYVMAGAGISYVNIQRDWSRVNESYFPEDHELWNGLQQDSLRRMPNFIPTLPIGAGARYFISDRFAVNLQATYRFTFTDYLDGFSHAVNSKYDDHFFSVTAGIVYAPARMKELKRPTVSY